jgi:hypothetical protein
MRIKMITAARVKTKEVQKQLSAAHSELRDSNAALTTSVDGPLEPTRDSVEAALEQSVEVEGKLSDAVNELEVVTELLRVAEAKNLEFLDQAGPGTRSGEGVQSVIAHIKLASG